MSYVQVANVLPERYGVLPLYSRVIRVNEELRTADEATIREEATAELVVTEQISGEQVVQASFSGRAVLWLLRDGVPVYFHGPTERTASLSPWWADKDWAFKLLSQVSAEVDGKYLTVLARTVTKVPPDISGVWDDKVELRRVARRTSNQRIQMLIRSAMNPPCPADGPWHFAAIRCLHELAGGFGAGKVRSAIQLQVLGRAMFRTPGMVE